MLHVGCVLKRSVALASQAVFSSVHNKNHQIHIKNLSEKVPDLYCYGVFLLFVFFGYFYMAFG